MLSVGDRITDDLEGENQYGAKRGLREGAHVLKEDLEDTTGLLVDETGDTLDTTTTSKTTDSLQHMATIRRKVVTRDTNTHGLGDTLDVVAQNLPVTLRTALAEALATFAAVLVLALVAIGLVVAVTRLVALVLRSFRCRCV